MRSRDQDNSAVTQGIAPTRSPSPCCISTAPCAAELRGFADDHRFTKPGLDLPAFCHVFDRHFEVNSNSIDAAFAAGATLDRAPSGAFDVLATPPLLKGAFAKDLSTTVQVAKFSSKLEHNLLLNHPMHGTSPFLQRCAPLAGLKDRPEGWGIRVRTLQQLWIYIQSDVTGYACAHGVVGREHVCLSCPCPWGHHLATRVFAPEEVLYLPMELNGFNVLKCVDPGVYQANNESLQANTAGLAYRKSKDLADEVAKNKLLWGRSVVGVDHGDGWIETKEADRLERVPVNMSLAVQRYVKPWTKRHGRPSDNAGLALVLNAGHLADRVGRTIEDLCIATVFTSHCWTDPLHNFFKTVWRNVDLDTVVWVCSFAIWQHGDIAGALSSPETCPFAQAMQNCLRVIVVLDAKADVFDRCWCVLEVKLAQLWSKPYDMALVGGENHADAATWEVVNDKLSKLDVRYCHASRDADKQAILKYAESHEGGIDSVNKAVRGYSSKALEAGDVLEKCRTGDLVFFRTMSDNDLEDWVSPRGRSLTHGAAGSNHVALVVFLLERTNKKHLNEQDDNGRTPISLAVERRALAGTQVLIAWRADLKVANVTGLTPLHYAASSGCRAAAEVLLDARACLEAHATFRGAAGHCPLTVAAREGHDDVVRLFLSRGACIETGAGDAGSLESGLTALHLAAQQGHTAVVTALVVAKAQVDRRESSTGLQQTALMYAIRNGFAAVVCVLLGARANVELADCNRQTCRQYLEYFEECTEDKEAAREIRFFLGIPPSLPSKTSCPLKRDAGDGMHGILKLFRAADTQRTGLLSRKQLFILCKTLGVNEGEAEFNLLVDMDKCAVRAVGADYIDYERFISFLFSGVS